MPQQKTPKLSVILPVHKAAKSISAAIESVLNQDFVNFELIIVENNADETTLGKINEFKDKRIVLMSEGQQGVAYALNRGLSEAKGKYIARMDADDICYEQRFSKQIAYLETTPEIALVGSQIFYESAQKNALEMSFFISWQNKILSYEAHALSRFVDSTIAHPTWMMRKELVESCGYYTLDFVPEDYEFLLRVLQNGYKIAKLPEKLLSWNDCAKRAIRTDSKYSNHNKDKVRLYYLAMYLKSNNIIKARKLIVCGVGKNCKSRVLLMQTFGLSIFAYTDVVKRNIPDFIPLSEIINPSQYVVLNFISPRGLQEQISAHFNDLGFTEGLDFMMV